MKETSLYSRVKDSIKDEKIILSDKESILLNRRDFHVNQISPVHATIQSIGVNVSYPYRVLMSFLDAFAIGLKGREFNIVLADPSLAIAAYHVWVRSGGTKNRGRVYAPKGIPKFPHKNGIIGELIEEFTANTNTDPAAKPEINDESFSFVIGNTRTSAQTIFAVDSYLPLKKGLLLLKDYARSDAFDEREYLESKKIFPSVTYEGHAFSIKI